MRLTAVLLFLAVTGIAVAQPTVGGVVNGASFTKGQAVAPGSLVSIFGTNFASSPASADSIPLSTSLGGVTVKFTSAGASFDGPMLFANGTQINVAVPWDLPASNSAEVVVTSGKGTSSAFTFSLGDFSPGIFAIGNLAAVQNADGSFAQPSGSIPGATSRPATPGSVVIIYATGLGPVSPAVQDGHIPPSGTLAKTIHTPFISIGGHQVSNIEFSGLSPQFVGLYQLNVEVPTSVAPGNNVPITITLGGITTPDTITIAVAAAQ